MDIMGRSVGGGACDQPMYEEKALLVPRNPTLTETLRAKKQHLESQLSEVSSALAALEANPEIEKVLNLVAKIRY